MPAETARRLVAEALGTGLLVATVVGSGIMGNALSADDAMSLLANTLATGAILVVLITIPDLIAATSQEAELIAIVATELEERPRWLQVVAVHTARPRPSQVRRRRRGCRAR